METPGNAAQWAAFLSLTGVHFCSLSKALFLDAEAVFDSYSGFKQTAAKKNR